MIFEPIHFQCSQLEQRITSCMASLFIYCHFPIRRSSRYKTQEVLGILFIKPSGRQALKGDETRLPRLASARPAPNQAQISSGTAHCTTAGAINIWASCGCTASVPVYVTISAGLCARRIKVRQVKENTGPHPPGTACFASALGQGSLLSPLPCPGVPGTNEAVSSAGMVFIMILLSSSCAKNHVLVTLRALCVRVDYIKPKPHRCQCKVCQTPKPRTLCVSAGQLPGTYFRLLHSADTQGKPRAFISQFPELLQVPS